MEKVTKAVAFGLIFIFVTIFIVGFILSLLLQFTDLTEQALKWTTASITFLALFIGGLIAGGKGKETGWMLGGITGLAFVAIIFLFQFLGFDTGYQLKQLLYHLAYILTAAFGGIIGVNLGGKTATK